jgi:hypothetical protein
MIEFGGVYYSFNLEGFSKAIKLGTANNNDLMTFKTVETKTNENGISTTKVTETTSERGLEVDTAKYELVKTMIEIVMDDVDIDADDTLGVDRAFDKFNLSYRIAFNTLLSYGVLVESELE